MTVSGTHESNESPTALERASRLARAGGIDAALAVDIDRFGSRTSVERTIWVRAVAYLAAADGSVVKGPFYVLGFGRALRRFMRKGFAVDDKRLLAAACDGAARQLAHVLATGEQAPFATPGRILLIPPHAPATVVKRNESTERVLLCPIPLLARKAEQLFVPDFPPLTDALDSSDLRNEGIPPTRLARIWQTDGRADLDRVAALARASNAAYALTSRIVAIDLTERVFPADDSGTVKQGVSRAAEVEAESALIRISDRGVLWSGRESGNASTRTEYVRGRVRLLSEEQCVVDAARVAFARLRFDLRDYLRRFER